MSVDRYDPELPSHISDAPDPLEAIRAFVPRRRVEPVEGMPRFTGGAVGALAYDAISSFEPSVPLPESDPVGTPAAAFIETDLVLVFDHLTHTLSAIASLHTDAPDLEGRYRIAEGAIFEALERTARPTADAELGGATSVPARQSRPMSNETSLGRDEYIHAVEVAKDAIAAGEAIQVVLARRQSFDLPTDPATGRGLAGIDLYRSLRRVNPSPYLFFVRVPSFEVVGASPELLLQVEGDRLTTHPIAGTRPRGRDRRRGRDPRRAAPARPEGAGRARHARRPRPERPRPGVAAGHRDGLEVHGRRALQPRPPPRVARRGPAQARSRRPRCPPVGLPGRHALGRPEGPGDAAHRGRGRRAPRALRRRGRLSRLRRQPRHGDHDPQRRPPRGPGPHPQRRRDRRRRACRSGSSRRPSTRRRPCGGRSRMPSRCPWPAAGARRTRRADAPAGRR